MLALVHRNILLTQAFSRVLHRSLGQLVVDVQLQLGREQLMLLLTEQHRERILFLLQLQDIPVYSAQIIQ